MTVKLLFTLLLVLAASSAAAVKYPNSAARGMQVPAGSARTLEMLRLGKDQVVAATGARALLKLANGSVIKLGRNGILVLDDIDQKQSQLQELVTSSIATLSGAFRFTAQALSRYQGACESRLRVVTSIVGIRG